PPQCFLRDRGGPEVGVVEDRPAIAAVDEGGRQVGLPDPLGQPGALRSDAELALELVGHAAALGDPVTLGEGGEDRLVPPAADDLDLTAGDERREALEEFGPLDAEPGQQRAGVVEGDVHAGMAVEGVEHRQVGPLVGLGDDPAEVAEKAGVSTAAVSFAFSSPDRLNTATASRILDIAQELGYRPDPVARMLTQRRTGAIGVLTPQDLSVIFTNPFFGTFSAGIAGV